MTTVRKDFDDWSRYDLEFRIAFIDSAIEDLEVFDLKDGISALEDEREESRPDSAISMTTTPKKLRRT